MKLSLCFVSIAAILMVVGCDDETTTPAACLAGSNQCGTTCVNLQEDNLNCGACGTVCAAGQVCSAGACTVSCQVGLDDCSGSCRNLQTDQNNCGTCGTACVFNQACVSGACQTWKAVTGPGNNRGFADFIPAGKNPLLATSDTVFSYSVSGDAWTTEHSGLTLPSTGYAYPAWVDDKLFWLSGSSMFSYTIATGDVVTTPVPIPTVSDSQTTADEAHNIYALAADKSIVQYNTLTAAVATFTGITDLPGGGNEPRLAWDSKTAKLYVADYSSTPFYSLDPATSTLTPLEAFPDVAGMNDAFCSDRHGHIYTTDADGANHQFWTFDTVTGHWTASLLPFTVGDSGTCTVTGDGYLLLLGDGVMYSLKLF
jgi:hypothetical protein